MGAAKKTPTTFPTPAATRAATRSHAVLGWINLLRVYAKIDRQIEQRLRPFGLTHPQFGLLAQLGRAHGPTQQDCSQALAVDKANISVILDHLERRGLVERLADPADRRYNRVYLTAQGREVLAAARIEVDGLLESAFADLSSGEQEQLRLLLGKLQRGLE